MKKTGRRAVRRYAALGAGLAPDCSELRDKEKPELTRLAKLKKLGESKMIRCLEMALYETRENLAEIKMIRCLEMALFQSRESRTKIKRSTEDLDLTLCVLFSHFRLSPSLYHFVHFGEIKKRKRKGADDIFYTSALVFFFLVYDNFTLC